MNIVFVQLPFLDHGYNYIAGNMPNAPATLQAYVSKIFPNIQSFQLSPHIQNFGADQTIINTILKLEPTHIAFTCYLWNVERSRALATHIKSIAPHIKILFGGPEIQLQSCILTHHYPEIDIFIIGEGEFFFLHYLHTAHSKFLRTIHGNTVFIQPARSFIPQKDMVEPYTSGFLTPMYDGTLSVEIIRGCPFTCNYCLYSKNTAKVRALGPDILKQIVKKAKKENIQELYLLAPTFNQSRHFTHYLDALISAKNTIPMHTELRADQLTNETINLLKKAGFKSVEVGLQTLNQACLQHVGRKTNATRELEGIIRLKDAGFKLQVGIIPGLPGDTPESFIKTINTLLDNGLGNEIELYPLMVLPGTALYDEALQQGATFMLKPPYYFIEGFNFSHIGMQAITQYFEDATGFVFHPPYIPSFVMNHTGTLTHSAYINLKKHKTIPHSVFEHIHTNHFIFYLVCDSSAQLSAALKKILAHTSYQTMLFSIVCIYNDLLDDSAVAHILRAETSDTFYCRMMHFADFYDRLPVRIFQLFESLEKFLEAKKQYSCVIPLLLLDYKNYEMISRNDYPYLFPIVIQKGFAPHCIEWLKENYQDSIELVSFQDEADQEYVYQIFGIAYARPIIFTTYMP